MAPYAMKQRSRRESAAAQGNVPSSPRDVQEPVTIVVGGEEFRLRAPARENAPTGDGEAGSHLLPRREFLRPHLLRNSVNGGTWAAESRSGLATKSEPATNWK